MGDRTLHIVRAIGVSDVPIWGSFGVNGSGAPINVKGTGFTVARTTTGTYVITFTDPWKELRCFMADILMDVVSAATTSNGPVGTATVKGKTCPTVTVFTCPTVLGTAGDINADANRRVEFLAVMHNSIAA